MIPKMIHYCWFGGNPLPKDIKKYMETWRKFFPDYEIKEWNERTFDVNCCQFVREAYEAKKWAFVSDYVRVSVMYQYGGIYLDTDIEVRNDISPYLNKNCNMLLGFEAEDSVMTAFFAAVPHNEFIKELLDYYCATPFRHEDGSFNVTPNPVLFTAALKKRGLILDGTAQRFAEEYDIYPYDYFNAFNIAYQKYHITEHTCMVHHCIGSWQTPRDRMRQKLKSLLLSVIGQQNFMKLKQLIKKN